MESTSSSSPRPRAHEDAQQPANARYASRTDVRRAIQTIVRNIHLRRIAMQRRPARLSKFQRNCIRHQASVIERLLYRRAASLKEYQDPSTLGERVIVAGRAARGRARRREAEREAEMEAEREAERRLAMASERSSESRQLLLLMKAGLAHHVDRLGALSRQSI